MAKKASPYERESRKFLARILPVASGSGELRKRAGFAPRAKEPALGLDVTFVTSAKMKSLNKKYRGKAYATDVLSFPAPEIFARQGHLGDLVICESVLERQAREMGHSAVEELRVLLVHGLLHLLGYDHEKSKVDASAMAKWESRLLEGMIERPARKAGLISRSTAAKPVKRARRKTRSALRT